MRNYEPQDSRLSAGRTGKTTITLTTRDNEAGDGNHTFMCPMRSLPARETICTILDFGLEPMDTEAGTAVNQQLSLELSPYQGCTGDIPIFGESETQYGAGPSSRMPLLHNAMKERGSGSGTQSVGADKFKKSNQVLPKPSAIPTLQNVCFFLDTFCNTWQPEGFVVRLQGLGAHVQLFLDRKVDCIVSKVAKTHSTTLAGNATIQKASERAKQLLLASSQRTTHGTPAHFAKMHQKTLLSPRELDIWLTSAEACQQEQKVARGKTTPAKANGCGGRPCARRHSVRVRGVDTIFRCPDGVPEWWHFPECDRDEYYQTADAPCMPKAVLKHSNTPGRTPHGANWEATQVHAEGKHKEPAPRKEARKVAGETGGYCHLCNIKHDHAKAHADSKGHQTVVEALLAAGDPRVKAPRHIADWEWEVKW
jgi:hypothetical protein